MEILFRCFLLIREWVFEILIFSDFDRFFFFWRFYRCLCLLSPRNVFKKTIATTAFLSLIWKYYMQNSCFPAVAVCRCQLRFFAWTILEFLFSLRKLICLPLVIVTLFLVERNKLGEKFNSLLNIWDSKPLTL